MNTSVTDIDLLGDLLFGPAQPLSGSNLSNDELIELAAESFTEKPFCIVRRWMILDVMLPEFQEREIKAQGLEATRLYAQSSEFDSESTYLPGDSILSDFQCEFDGCIFESKHRIFILAGRGARKHVSLPTVEALAADIMRAEKTYG
jgi:hypothetical protein